MKEIPAMFCDHANECPQSCPCAVNCYCRTRTCKSTPRIADLVAHALVMDNRGMAHDAPHRWRCSCGKTGEWKSVIRSARIGGAKHIAAMERGR